MKQIVLCVLCLFPMKNYYLMAFYIEEKGHKAPFV